MVYSFPSANAVMMSLSPAAMGEDRPEGAGVFHFKFLSGPNSTGGFCPWATADPPGPRNCGHTSGCSAPRPTAANNPIVMNATKVLIPLTSLVSGQDLFTAF